MMNYRFLTLAATGMILSGCTFLGGAAQAPEIYMLNPVPASAQNSMYNVPAGVKVAVRRPYIVPGLKTDKIAVLKEGRTLDYISHAQWAGRLDDVLQNFLQVSFENNLPLGSVLEKEYQASGDWDLTTTVRDFQAEYSGYAVDEAPVVKITVLMTLTDRNLRRPINKMILTQQVKAQENTQTAIVAAFETALRDISSEAVQRFFLPAK